MFDTSKVLLFNYRKHYRTGFWKLGRSSLIVSFWVYNTLMRLITCRQGFPFLSSVVHRKLQKIAQSKKVIIFHPLILWIFPEIFILFELFNNSAFIKIFMFVKFAYYFLQKDSKSLTLWQNEIKIFTNFS